MIIFDCCCLSLLVVRCNELGKHSEEFVYYFKLMGICPLLFKDRVMVALFSFMLVTLYYNLFLVTITTKPLWSPGDPYF
jgi:hypothetical protein